MPKIREWLRKNPDKAKDLMAENNRFIFQRITDADGPVGALGVSLTAGRSLAVDNKYIPLGAMMWLDTVNPDNGNLKKIVFAQDIGSAIKGVVRGDYFWGQGEQALKHAGRMNSKGKYYIFAPKNSAVKVD
jgi:membrane-bound lytic murein transglycosylase A